MHRFPSLAILPALAAAAQAQEGTSGPSGSPPSVVASFSNFGQGCPGTGWQSGADTILPASLAAGFGNSNNNIPLSWTPTRYQQVFLGSEVGTVVLAVGLGLRQDNQFRSLEGRQINLEVSLGGTTFDNTSLTTTFASNFNSTVAPKQLVFAQRDYCLPAMPATSPTNPADILFTIPFDSPYVAGLGPTENLLVEMLQSSNSNNNATFTYPLDAGSNIATARLWGTPTSPTGTVGLNYGMVMVLRSITGTIAPVPHLYHCTLPRLGQTFHFGLTQAALTAPVLLFVGSSNSNSGGVPLPFDLTPIGAPGCHLLVTVTQIVVAMATRGGGDLAGSLTIPANTALDGANFYMQAFIYDPSVNALGFVASDGGMGTFGS